MVFCNLVFKQKKDKEDKVTILILIDGFLQLKNVIYWSRRRKSHNPYFNRWFSAMYLQGIEEVQVSESQSLF